MQNIAKRRITYLMITVVIGVIIYFGAQSQILADSHFDWRTNWEVAPGFSIGIDTDGYQFPVSIAFVPNPGDRPKDPLYFVTELRGKVKVVTNDRSVFTFASDFFQLVPRKELPDSSGSLGLTGICLEPNHGYVFVTFAYQDSEGVLRNNVVRFTSVPENFSVRPTSQTAFTEVFSAYESAVSHQIGACQVIDDLLYISVGDAQRPANSQLLDNLQGKIIRMTLEGGPVTDNPFYQDDEVKNASNFIWAYGLRNPFGLRAVENRLYAVDNGLSLDRFMEITKSENYLYNGQDTGIAARADVVFADGNGVAQLDYNISGSSVFPKRFESNFFVVVTSGKSQGGSAPYISTFKYDLEENITLSVPEPFIKYRGGQIQQLVGVGFGPDGLFFVPLFPNQGGLSAIFKVTFDPDNEHPFILDEGQVSAPENLILEKGCSGCHIINGQPGGAAGPVLNTQDLVPRLEARLNSAEYTRQLAEVSLLDTEPFVSFEEARKEIERAEGLDKVRLWIKYKVQEPKFDNPDAMMPNLGVTEGEAAIVADLLLFREDETKGLYQRAKDLLPEHPGRRHLVLFFTAGAFAGAIALASMATMIMFLLRRRARAT